MNKYPHLEVISGYPKLITNSDKLRKLDFKGRVHQYFAWARERHSMFLKRKFYDLPPPWSDVPVMANTRWCNVYRELDKVTQYFVREVYRPNVDNPNLWFAAMACRYINHPETIQDLVDSGNLGMSGSWDWRKAASVIDKRKKAGLQFVTGAYLVNSVSSSDFPKDIIGSKPYVICYRLKAAWDERHQVQGEFKDTMERAYKAFSSFSGFGPFLSYQALVDLSYSPTWLKNAPDYNSFNSAGPGTKRGAQRVKYGRTKDNFEVISQAEVTEVLQQMLEFSRDPEFWPQTGERNMGNGWAPLSLSNLSNCNCEVDKLFRLVLGEGETRSKYKPSSNHLQESLL